MKANILSLSPRSLQCQQKSGLLFVCLLACFGKRAKETSRENREKLCSVLLGQEDSVPFGASRGSTERVLLVAYIKDEVAQFPGGQLLASVVTFLAHPPCGQDSRGGIQQLGECLRSISWSAGYGGSVPGSAKGCENEAGEELASGPAWSCVLLHKPGEVGTATSPGCPGGYSGAV